MAVLLEQYWWVLVIALLLGMVIAWAIFASGRKTRVETSITPDVLDDGAAPARRNQAFIDAPPAAFTAGVPAPPPASVATPEHPTEIKPAPVAAVTPIPSVMASEGPALTRTEAQAPQPSANETPSGATVDSSDAEDDLTRIKGLGPKISQLLQSLGVTSYAQIAAWSDTDIERIDAQLGKFQGRIRRDNWVEQAVLLSKGDASGFADRFGKV